ncbi:MAG TPA: LCP family protein [Mycobacteriales bacterium]|nr:LCP family protein [Mycobacteriales bacterium]
MSQRPGPPPEDAPLPPHLDPRGRRGRRERERARPASTPPAPEPAAAPAGVPTVLPDGPDSPTPRRRRGRTLRRVLAGVLVLVLLVVAAGLGALAYYDRQIDRIPVAALDGGAGPDGDDVNYLLVGTDSRRGLTPEELQQARTTLDDGEAGLTDTIILLHVPAAGTPTLVSFPRDSWVQQPDGGRGRINSVYPEAEDRQPGSGPSALVQTVEQLSGLQIDHYVEVGFIAFLRLTDALGGVEVNLCQPAQDADSGIDLPAGQQRIDGGDALAFVRQRKGLPRGDLDRVARQQYFLGAVARQTLTPGTLLRPDRALDLLDAVTSSIRADEDLSTFDLARLAWRLRGAASGSLAFTTVPVADPAATRGGASVVLLDEPALPGFFADLSPDTEQQPPPTVTIAPSAIRLEVRNGTTRSGLARTAGDDLAGLGFTILRAANADRQDYDASVVLHGANRADSAQTVAAAVPGATVQQDDSVGANGLVLVVGSSYTGVREVTVANAPPPTSAAPPSPAPGGTPASPGPAAKPDEEAALPCIT